MSETRPPREQARTRVGAPGGSIARRVALGWLRPVADAPARALGLAAALQRAASACGRALEQTRIPPAGLGFLAVVAAPTLAVTLYFAFIAADQFIVETRFAVRAVEIEQDATKSDSTPSFAFTPSGQNAYIVVSYIRSRAIVEDVAAKLRLREMFRRPEADFWARLSRDATIDELTDYWKVMVETNVDATSGLVVVSVRAFRKKDALALASAIVAASEQLVNRISERARRDATAMAEADVRRSFEAVQASLGALHAFRDAFGMIDPSQTSGEISRLLATLLQDKIKLESELFVATHELSPEAPTVRVLREQLETTEAQIKEQRAKLTADDGKAGALSGSLAKFEELEVRRMLAERFYALAKADLDRAQLRANRQSIYLNVFVPPFAPEQSRYPHRVSAPIVAFLMLAALYGVAAMILASIEDHRL